VAALDDVDEVVIDGTHLTFLHHRAVCALGDFAADLGGTVVVRTGIAGLSRLVELLELDALLRVEAVA
jgi:hypothetical protein